MWTSSRRRHPQPFPEGESRGRRGHQVPSLSPAPGTHREGTQRPAKPPRAGIKAQETIPSASLRSRNRFILSLTSLPVRGSAQGLSPVATRCTGTCQAEMRQEEEKGFQLGRGLSGQLWHGCACPRQPRWPWGVRVSPVWHGWAESCGDTGLSPQTPLASQAAARSQK